MLRSNSVLCVFLAVSAVSAAPADRVTHSVNENQRRSLTGNVHHLLRPELDRGPANAGLRMDYMVVMLKPSPAQQSELDRLLADQQNPGSPLYHKWLTPEEFGSRFGASVGDHSKVVAWLTSRGFRVNESARSRNWVAFSGTAGQVTQSLRTPIHRFSVDGKLRFANTVEPSIPEAFEDVIDGFLGLNDIPMESFARPVSPQYTSGNNHYLVPEDFATIYNIKPLYDAGFDGTGQSIAVVGQSNILLSDIRAFRTRYGLPANDPKLLPYSGTEPGFTGAQLEGNLDLEWAGAIAPKAALTYVYGTSAFTAFLAAVSANIAPIISISYGGCEVGFRPSFYRSIGQQANAQGITVLVASGDSGAAGCNAQGSEPFATRGKMVDFPAVLPEVTAVGGTQFVEGSGAYWSTTNSAAFGSALSYIPEAAWNESGPGGLLSSGGGASQFHPRPAWQAGPGVPDDQVRHIPDISLSAAQHDAYYVYFQGMNGGVAGTSASAPALAGIVALLNQYQVTKGFQPQPGLGNINPQLYRLAQSAPSAFHDITSGHNIVQCMQGSPDCISGSYGYEAGPGYDMATGLGTIDANNLITQWNSKPNNVTVRLVTSATRGTLNESMDISGLVAPASGGGTPTGTVEFSSNGVPLGSAQLTPRGIQGQAADASFPLYLLGTGTFTLVANYSGDAAFSGGGAGRTIQVVAPTGAAAIVPTAANTVWPVRSPQGLVWQTTISLREAAGVPAIVTGFTIDGVPQPLGQYFASPNIPASSTVNVNVVLTNLPAPVIRIFGFTGVDSAGQTWARQVQVNFFPLPESSDFDVTASPLIATRNTAGDPSCQWQVRLGIDEFGGYLNRITGLSAGGVDLTSQIPAIFGTTRLGAWSSLQGILCFGDAATPATQTIFVTLSNGLSQELLVSLAGPPVSSAKLTASPAGLTLSAAGAQSASAFLSVNVDKAEPWTATVYPSNRTGAWLRASPLSGVGPAQINLTASGAGFGSGVYHGTVVIQSTNTTPQFVSVPVMFVLGGATSGISIRSIGNSASYGKSGSPGMLLSVFGAGLANTTRKVTGNPLQYSVEGVSATVNGLGAPLLYISPTQIDLQIPFEAGAGPAVLGIHNNGQISGFSFQIAPSAPGIFTDGEGNIFPQVTPKPGATTTLYLTGAGDLTPALLTAYAPTGSLATMPKPVLPVSATVDGAPAFVQFVGHAPGLIGLTQVNFVVPPDAAVGTHQVVVTVGGVSSPPVKFTVP